MNNNNLKKIFLSASVPYLEKHKEFYDTADFVAIRDAVRALSAVVIPKAHLVWGGHPAITPIIHYVMARMNADIKEHVTLYQSYFFKDHFPKDNVFFENVIIIPANTNRENSLADMRKAMFDNNEFSVGIFIGGMKGVIEEYELFRVAHPNALILAVASTGAAAKKISEKLQDVDSRLLNDYAYMSLFKDLLKDFLIK